MFTRLKLTNFKSFREADIPLGPFTVIIGTNASGKSNIIDAFRLVQGLATGGSLSEVVDGGRGVRGERLWEGIRGGMAGLIHAPPDQSRHAQVGIEASFAQRGFEYSATVAGPNRGRRVFLDEVRWDSGGDVRHGAGALVGTDQADAEEAMRENLASPSARFTILAAGRSVLGLRTPEGEVDPEQIESVAPFARAASGIGFMVLDAEAMREPSQREQTALTERGHNLSSCLSALCEDAERKELLLEWLGALTPVDVRDVDFERDLRGRILVTLVENGGQRTPADSASDGTLRFLGLAAALLGPDRAGTHFIEELENGIHPTRLSLLVDLLESATRDGDVQVIATTHSPLLLGYLSARARENALLTYRLEGESETHVTRIVDIADAERLLEKGRAASLFQSGWFEDVMAFRADGGKS